MRDRDPDWAARSPQIPADPFGLGPTRRFAARGGWLRGKQCVAVGSSQRKPSALREDDEPAAQFRICKIAGPEFFVWLMPLYSRRAPPQQARCSPRQAREEGALNQRAIAARTLGAKSSDGAVPENRLLEDFRYIHDRWDRAPVVVRIVGARRQNDGWPLDLRVRKLLQ
jgi:hypothetical protein